MEINLLLFVLLCGTIILTIWFFLKFFVARVHGFSMHPNFKNGEFLIVKRKFTLKLNNVYVFKDPEGDICIKRLTNIIVGAFGEVQCYFTGDNAEDSIDSRDYGLVRSSSVIGEVVKNIWRN